MSILPPHPPPSLSSDAEIGIQAMQAYSAFLLLLSEQLLLLFLFLVCCKTVAKTLVKRCIMLFNDAGSQGRERKRA